MLRRPSFFMDTDRLEKAAELIRKSRKTVALTGAGISTPSGIPDFRSPGSGLWEKVDPYEVAMIDSFMRNPEKFFSFMEPVARMMDEAAPNAAHLTLSKWEREGRLHSVITQNIDNLHQKAGSTNVLELHGNARRAFCMKCRKRYSAEQMKEKLAAGPVPYCDCPGAGVIKPDVILFGEQLPMDVLVQSERDAKECDLMIVAGTSLTVSPASMIPQIALQAGADIIVVNIQPTYVDGCSQVIFREDLDAVFPAIDEILSA